MHVPSCHHTLLYPNLAFLLTLFPFSFFSFFQFLHELIQILKGQDIVGRIITTHKASPAAGYVYIYGDKADRIEINANTTDSKG